MNFARTTLLIVVAVCLLSLRGHAASSPLPFDAYVPMANNGRLAVPLPTPSTTPADPLVARREVIRLVNEYRVANGCPAAPENPILMEAAQAWSDYMQAHNIFEHSSAQYPQWYTSRGYSWDASENLASGQDTAQQAVHDWQASPNHNRTLLSCYYASTGATYDLGVGLNGRLWTLALGERLP